MLSSHTCTHNNSDCERSPDHESGGLKICSHVSNLESCVLEAGNGLPKLHPVLHILLCLVQTKLRTSNATSCYIDPAPIHCAHCILVSDKLLACAYATLARIIDVDLHLLAKLMWTLLVPSRLKQNKWKPSAMKHLAQQSLASCCSELLQQCLYCLHVC